MHVFICSEITVRQAGGIFIVACLCVTSVYLRVLEYFLHAFEGVFLHPVNLQQGHTG